MTHFPIGTDADYYGHDKPPASYRCFCGRWFLTPDALHDHIDREVQR